MLPAVLAGMNGVKEREEGQRTMPRKASSRHTFHGHTRKRLLRVCGLLATFVTYGLFVREGIADPSSHAIRGRVVDAQAKPAFSASRSLEVALSGKLQSLASGDFDGDGHADVAISDEDASSLLLLRRQKTDAFLASRVRLPNAHERVAGAGDLNGDGSDDVLLWDAAHQAIQIGIGGSSGMFEWQSPIAVPQIGSVDAAFVEHASAGQLPAIVLSPGSLGEVMMLRGHRVETAKAFHPTGVASDPYWPAGRVFADFDDDGRLELLSATGVSMGAHWFVTGRNSPSFEWASLPEGFRSGGAIALELNGDGYEDALVYPEPGSPLGWYAIYNAVDSELPQGQRGTALGDLEERNGVEVGIDDPFPGAVDRKTIRSGDFDGDGFEDLIGVARAEAGSREQAEIWVAHRIPPRGISDVAISDPASGAVTTSGDDGSFTINATEDLARLTFERAGYVFRASLKTAGVRSARPLIVAGEDLSPSRENRGSAVGILGVPAGPYVCLGYHANRVPLSPPFADRYQPLFRWMTVRAACPRHSAVFAVEHFHRNWRGTIDRPIDVNCCRLPADDILTDEVAFTAERCPEGFLMTGVEVVGAAGYRVRCSKINQSRYQLSAERPGRYLGFALSMRGEGARDSSVAYPLAAQYGIRRRGWFSTRSGSCTGGPDGGVFTALTGDECSEHQSRRIEYRGTIDGDPGQGSPVKIFPDCAEIADPFSPLGGCRSRRVP